MGMIVGFHGCGCIAVHRDDDVIVWVNEDELAKDTRGHIGAAALEPPLVTVAFIAL